MKDLIQKDIDRCNNHRCSLRSNCRRYMQLKNDNRLGRQGEISVNRFGNTNGTYTKQCNHYISIS